MNKVIELADVLLLVAEAKLVNKKEVHVELWNMYRVDFIQRKLHTFGMELTVLKRKVDDTHVCVVRW